MVLEHIFLLVEVLILLFLVGLLYRSFWGNQPEDERN